MSCIDDITRILATPIELPACLLDMKCRRDFLRAINNFLSQPYFDEHDYDLYFTVNNNKTLTCYAPFKIVGNSITFDCIASPDMPDERSRTMPIDAIELISFDIIKN